MNLAKLKDELRRDEGLRLKPYRCTSGAWTLGYGRNLSALMYTEEQIRALYGGGISLHIAEQWLNFDIEMAIATVRQLFPKFDLLSETRQRVLVNMAFNIGYRLSKFKRFLDALDSEDYEKASREMKDSVWYRQVGNRAKRLVKMMETDSDEGI